MTLKLFAALFAASRALDLSPLMVPLGGVGLTELGTLAREVVDSMDPGAKDRIDEDKDCDACDDDGEAVVTMLDPDMSRVNGGGCMVVGFAAIDVLFCGESNGYEVDVVVGVKLSWNVAESEDSGAV